jgi:hypothetical protein
MSAEVLQLTLTMDERTARLIHTALKEFNQRLFTGDPAGRIQSARALDLMAYLESGMLELKSGV